MRGLMWRASFDDGLSEASAWEEDTWELGHATLLELQGVARSTFAAASRKFIHLDI